MNENMKSSIPMINYVELNYSYKHELSIVPNPGGNTFNIIMNTHRHLLSIYTTLWIYAHFCDHDIAVLMLSGFNSYIIYNNILICMNYNIYNM